MREFFGFPQRGRQGRVTSIARYELLEVGVCSSHGDYDHRDIERYVVRSASGRKRTYTLLVAAREAQV